jgi:zinc transporter, ZIP family
MNAFTGIVIPFIGTTLGAACVFFVKKELKPQMQKSLLGFASGVMVAASVWSLIIPAIEESSQLGKFACIPAAAGIAAGMGFLLLLDIVIPHLHIDSDIPEGPRSNWSKTTKLFLAVTLHNIPEGMAPGIVFAGVMSGSSRITMSGAFALAVGIAIQNFPEGAIISIPLASEGNGKFKSFIYGTLSGAVEPVAAVLTILLTKQFVPLMPYLLSFAAGAMLYVVVEELIPEASDGEHSNFGVVGFAVGFILMMVLDVMLG